MGNNPQNGQEILRRMLAKLLIKWDGDFAVDDVSGVKLVPELVRKAREVEMAFFEKMHVYDRVPVDHQQQTGGKIVGTR